MEKCFIYNYADFNSLSVASSHMLDVLSYISRDYKNAMKWVRDNGMQANPSKFQFMSISHRAVDAINAMLRIDDNIGLKAEPASKVPNTDPIGGIIALETCDAHPGHCRLRVYGDHTRVSEYMMAFDHHFTPDIYRKRGGCIVEKDGTHWISPGRVVQLLTDHPSSGPSEALSSPAVMLKGGTTEIVPTLLCSHSLPFLKAYLKRTRYGNWPSPDILAVIAKLPTLIVGAGHKLSASRETEWRISCSHLEYVLITDLPVWVKQAYCGVKYILKCIDREYKITTVNYDTLPSSSDFESGSRTKLCSFHLKMTLLWELENPDAWVYESSFYLMIHLFIAFLKFIEARRMPHYFMPQCNLLQCVAPEELKVTSVYIKDQILRDPIPAIVLAPKYPRQLYGCVEKKDECADDKDIILGFRNLIRALTKSPSDVPKSTAFLSSIFQRLDKYRLQKYHIGQTKQDPSDSLVSLVDMLDKMKKTGPISPDLRVLVYTGFRIESTQSEHQISAATTEVCGNCGRPNHREERCFAANKLTCDTCHKRGHNAWLCPNDLQAHNFPECLYVRHLFATSDSMMKKWMILDVYSFWIFDSNTIVY